jgi:hypothetical protein
MVNREHVFDFVNQPRIRLGMAALQAFTAYAFLEQAPPTTSFEIMGGGSAAAAGLNLASVGIAKLVSHFQQESLI